MKKKNIFFLILIGISCFTQSLQCQNGDSSKIAHSLSTMSSDLRISANTLRSVVDEYHKDMARTAVGVIGAVAAISFGVWLIKKIANMVDEDIQENDELREELIEDITSEASIKEDIEKFSHKIEQRLESLLKKRFIGEGQKLMMIFPTIKSKIFAIQNWQDFFQSFEGPYANLNLWVYQACMKKINELESKLVKKRNKDGEIELQDPNEYDRLIDDERNNYMKKYQISAVTLKDMSLDVLQEKIKEMQSIYDQLEKEEITEENNIKITALLSLSYYLQYKKILLSRKKLSLLLVPGSNEWNLVQQIQLKKEKERKEWQEKPVSLFSRLRAAWNKLFYGYE